MQHYWLHEAAHRTINEPMKCRNELIAMMSIWIIMSIIGNKMKNTRKKKVSRRPLVIFTQDYSFTLLRATDYDAHVRRMCALVPTESILLKNKTVETVSVPHLTRFLFLIFTLMDWLMLIENKSQWYEKTEIDLITGWALPCRYYHQYVHYLGTYLFDLVPDDATVVR